jgi:hypothetical protein
VTALFILSFGFLLGIKHATEADHLAAIATLATRQSSLAQTMRQGVAWGVGHTFTLMLFGGFVLALGRTMPQHLAQALELAVGFMLVALGLDVLRRLLRQRIHFHVHRHDHDLAHVHAHSHDGEVPHEEASHDHEHGLPRRALAIGMMHGMAGSAALILLSLEAVESIAMGIVYIALFGAGSIVGMALLSVAIAIPLRLSGGYLGRLGNGLTALVGVATCALGAFMVYEIGFAEGLLIG